VIVLAVMIAPLALGGRAAAADPVIAAAGDIACDPNDSGYNGGAGTSDRCRQRATSDLLVGAGAGLAAVLPLGDIQYDSASSENIAQVYDPTWGRVKSISRPVLGNHETNGNDYFDYFNGVGAVDGPAGPRGKGWYSFDVGNWHLVALNSNCRRPEDTTNVVDCGVGSEQERWLRADLAAHATSCTLAYSHHARYSSGHDGNNTSLQPLWEALDDAGAELLLSGHSHNYERVAPMDRNGDLNRANGVRQFVVGTGGAFFTGGLDTRIPNSEVAQNDTFGVLFLTLHPFSYEWRFVPEAGKTWSDTGTGSCRGTPPPPPPDESSPSPPTAGVGGGAAASGGGPLKEALVFPPADTTAPGVTLAGAKRQRLGATVRVSLTATTEDLWVTASGVVSVSGASRVFRLKPVRDMMVTRGTKEVLRLKLSKTARQAIKRALKKRARAKVRVKLSMRDRAGNVTTRRRAISLSL
jgi:hypothetical protein